MGIEGAAPHPRDFEEKENDEKDSVLKASKLQSPAKGCKSFMAPTISAASKFTPSPRKKVLVERNDPVRTSISLSDGKAMFFSAMPNVSEDLEPKSELDSNLADSENKKAVHDSHPVSRPLKKVTFSDIPSYPQHSTESVITDSDGLKLESSLIAPLDADPSLPPYDPKTNYLSPRPQFIRYKPNPRVGMLLNKEKWLDPDDSLMAEIMSQSFSDSDEGSDESHKEEMEVAAASADMVIGADEEIEAESHVSESLPVSRTPAEEGFVQNNEKKQRRSLSRLVCFSMIMMLLIAAACVSISPSFDEFVIKDLILSDLSNVYQQSRVAVAASARLSFGRLARHVNHVSASSVSLVFKLANELGKGEKRAQLQFMNLSDLQENPWNEGRFPNIVASLEPVENLEEDELEEEVEVDMMDAEMDYAFEEEEYADEELVLDTDLLDTFEEEEAYAYADVDVDADEISPDSVKLAELESEYLQEFQSETELNSDDQSAAASQHQETELEAAIEAELDKLETISSDETRFDTIMPESTLHAVGIPSLFAGLLAVAAAAFIYQYKRNHPSSSNVVRVEPVLGKQTDNGLIHQEKEFSQNWQTENDGGESYCPSEMSGSFQKSASNSMREANEVQSSERKARKYTKRESLASSSGSPSYGSFTTYERIPIKSNANVDEEIMTPVRRSSRIRNHHATAE